MNILIIHPSARFSGSGFYLNDFSRYVAQRGHRVLIWAESAEDALEGPVQWRRLRFHGGRLARSLRDELRDFEPDLVIEVGVRTVPMRAALEAIHLHQVPMVVQCEDDEYQPFLKHSPYDSTDMLEEMNTRTPSIRWLLRTDWGFTLRVLVDPGFDRWVEPWLRWIVYRYASGFGCIWWPIAERVGGWFERPTFVFPPLFDGAALDEISRTSVSRASFLAEWGIDPDSYVIFVSGTIYSYSPEFRIFLDALKLACENTSQRVTLVISGKNWLLSDDQTRAYLAGAADFVSMGGPGETDYVLMNKYADLIATPGLDDTFNRYRLSSRVVKALYLGRPVFTFRTGFGESLSSKGFAFLTETNEAGEWARVLTTAMRSSSQSFDESAHAYADEHFEVQSCAPGVLAELEKLKASFGQYGLAEKVCLRLLLVLMQYGNHLYRAVQFVRRKASGLRGRRHAPSE